MTLKKLSLFDFRNYLRANFEFSPKINLIIGPNASGKTNLLEAIYLLGTGTSFRATRSQQMIAWEGQAASVEGEVEDGSSGSCRQLVPPDVLANCGRSAGPPSAGDTPTTSESPILSLKVRLVADNGLTRREFLIDNVVKTRHAFLECLNTVFFGPDEVRIVSGSPSRRRDFINKILSPVDWQYHQALLAYERALKRRNFLLDRIREGEAKREELFYWDSALVKNGEVVGQKRRFLFDFVNRLWQENEDKKFVSLSCRYERSVITAESLQRRLEEDVKFGSTSVGPHRDDFAILDARFKNDEKSLAFWGSRGQQRMAVLALKLAQLSFIEKLKKNKPILLLDDIFSELDEEGRVLVSSLLDNYQTIITATEKPAISLPATTIKLGR